MKEPFFSIIVPCRNSTSKLDILFQSLLSQTFKDFEVLICDDKSTDNLKQFIKKYEDKLNIRYLKNVSDKYGPGIARNLGIEHADGKYITFIDSDDSLYDENSLDIVHELIINFGCIFVYSREFVKNENYERYVWCMLHGKYYKKSFLDDNNIRFDESMFYKQDVYFALLFELYRKYYNARGFITDKITYNYILYTNSISIQKNKDKDKDRDFLTDNLKAIYYPYLHIWRRFFKKDDTYINCQPLFDFLNENKPDNMNTCDKFIKTFKK